MLGCLVVVFYSRHQVVSDRSVYTSKLRHLFYSFTVVCLVAWPLNESEAVGDLVMHCFCYENLY